MKRMLYFIRGKQWEIASLSFSYASHSNSMQHLWHSILTTMSISNVICKHILPPCFHPTWKTNYKMKGLLTSSNFRVCSTLSGPQISVHYKINSHRIKKTSLCNLLICPLFPSHNHTCRKALVFWKQYDCPKLLLHIQPQFLGFSCCIPPGAVLPGKDRTLTSVLDAKCILSLLTKNKLFIMQKTISELLQSMIFLWMIMSYAQYHSNQTNKC